MPVKFCRLAGGDPADERDKRVLLRQGYPTIRAMLDFRKGLINSALGKVLKRFTMPRSNADVRALVYGLSVEPAPG